jgi:hypothetical protein
MLKKLLLTLLAGVFVCFAGCASVEKQAFNRAANTTIKSITVLEPTPAEGFGVLVLNHPALGFGLIGATIYATEMKVKSTAFDDAMKPLNWSLTDDLTKQLVAALQADGYLVKRAKVAREGRTLIKDYAAIRSDASLKDALATDAWLDVQTRDPLYVANSPTADYVPSIGLTVRLVTAADQTLLYREDFFYGFSFSAPRLAAVVIASDPKYRYATTDDLKRDTQATLAGAAQGVPLLVERIVADLRHDGLKPVTKGTTTDTAIAPK